MRWHAPSPPACIVPLRGFGLDPVFSSVPAYIVFLSFFSASLLTSRAVSDAVIRTEWPCLAVTA